MNKLPALPPDGVFRIPRKQASHLNRGDRFAGWDGHRFGPRTVWEVVKVATLPGGWVRVEAQDLSNPEETRVANMYGELILESWRPM